jgi:hypothetical protein
LAPKKVHRKKLNRLIYFWAMGVISDVLDHLNGWEPKGCKNELEYHASLEAFLRSKCPDAHIEREYRHNGTTADMMLMRSALMGKVAILFEVKRDLVKKTEFDRLVGQVMALGAGTYNIMVVLVGRTDPKYVSRFVETFAEHMKDDALDFLGKQRTLWLVVMKPDEAGKK